MKLFILSMILSFSAHAAEWQVAVTGKDSDAGTINAPFRTIQRAADLAQPGDVITVHAGVYRERIDPPRGGASEAQRITYQAAAGEKVVITGAEPIKGWVKVTNDTWKAMIPNTVFGGFNPYSDPIKGDWCGNPGGYHTGAVYLNGHWLKETTKQNDVLALVGATKQPGQYLLNVAWLRPEKLTQVAAVHLAAKQGMMTAACSEGGQCLGYIEADNWVRYDRVDFGESSTRIEIRAASETGGGNIEIRLDSPDGELLGIGAVSNTGGWQKWDSFTAEIKPTRGEKNVCLVFKSNQRVDPLWFGQVDAGHTTIWAQFPGVNPNESDVEINVRQTVFTPSKTGINFLTVRGFELRSAASPWAPPTAAQIGVISAYWCKGWIIENNAIRYSPCAGLALGKYGDEWDNRAESAEGYVGTINRALKNGWNKETVGSHLVRNNEISHCEQTGIVGSLGCSFSTVTGNSIHDIHRRNLYGGAEMAGIKFHGAIDVVISHNHIYRCGPVGGIWLDWMAQGTRVTGNLMHDNATDLFMEVNHGPYMIDHNLFLSGSSVLDVSQGGAYVHNLFAGSLQPIAELSRETPYHPAHSTEVAGLLNIAGGDNRFINNLFVGPAGLDGYDAASRPMRMSGNVFVDGAKASKHERAALVNPEFNLGLKLIEKADGWYLTLALDPVWREEMKREPVTTELLGKAAVPGLPYVQPDENSYCFDTDSPGEKRNVNNPFPGPFEKARKGTQEIKVWP